MNVQSDVNGVSGDYVTRKLEMFWIIDCSGSMGGQRIEIVNNAIKNTIPTIRKIQDDNNLEVFIRILKFGSDFHWHVGPDSVLLDNLNWSDMKADLGGTYLGKAIEEIVPLTKLEALGKRNVPPVMILLSDGYTHDSADFNLALEKLNKTPWGCKALRFSIGIGDDFDKNDLDQFVSPYLRDECGIQTLEAKSINDIATYIKTTSTVAVTASSQSTGAIEKDIPVQIDPSALESNEIDFDNISSDMSF